MEPCLYVVGRRDAAVPPAHGLDSHLSRLTDRVYELQAATWSLISLEVEGNRVASGVLELD